MNKTDREELIARMVAEYKAELEALVDEELAGMNKMVEDSKACINQGKTLVLRPE